MSFVVACSSMECRMRQHRGREDFGPAREIHDGGSSPKWRVQGSTANDHRYSGHPVGKSQPELLQQPEVDLD